MLKNKKALIHCSPTNNRVFIRALAEVVQNSLTRDAAHSTHRSVGPPPLNVLFLHYLSPFQTIGQQ